MENEENNKIDYPPNYLRSEVGLPPITNKESGEKRMDDIEIVIKISEKEYDAIKENKYGVFSGHIFETIRNGIPLPEEKINEERWLPIPGKWLPEESGTYLVTMRVNFFDEIMYITTYAHYFARANRWVVGDDAFEEDKIVAWMPFPEAYKESEEKKE